MYMTAFVKVPDKNMELNFCSQNPFFILFTPKIVFFDLTRESHDSRGAHSLIESICGCDSNRAAVSFNGENVYDRAKTSDGLIDVCNSHAALLIHHLLRTLFPVSEVRNDTKREIRSFYLIVYKISREMYLFSTILFCGNTSPQKIDISAYSW
jgi:hypothetical protein